MPSVLFLNRVHPPAEGATGQLLAELAAGLAQAGWEVTVVTGRTGPSGLPRSETIDGVRVERVGGMAFTRASHWRRALSYLTLYPALLWRAWRLPRADVVVTLTDPPLLLVLGPVLQWLKGSRPVHWAQDVYPELAEELGVVPRGGVVARVCRALSTWALRRHERVIAIGDCMRERLEARGLPAGRIGVIPNWSPAVVSSAADISAGAVVGATAVPAGSAFRREHGLEGKFVVMYSGNFGLAHPFEAMLEAARVLQRRRPGAHFVFVGHGPRLAAVQRQAGLLRLGNALFLPPQPREMLAESLGAADVHLASMHDRLCGLVVPSKVYGILAAGRPCIFLGPEDSEVARRIRRHDCGTVLPAASGAVLADCLEEWMDDPARVRAAGVRAWNYSQQAGGGAGALRAVTALLDEVLRDVRGGEARPGGGVEQEGTEGTEGTEESRRRAA